MKNHQNFSDGAFVCGYCCFFFILLLCIDSGISILIFVRGSPIHSVICHRSSVVEPEPQGAETFGWSRSRNIEVSAPGQLKYFEKI